jgi:hypothetical protein
MDKKVSGVVFGAVAGIIDVIPMVLQDLSWDANLSAFLMWVVVGFLIAAADLNLPSAIKGLLIAFLVLIPAAVLIGWKEPASLLPIGIMTIILGSLLGWTIERFAANNN